jgi:hypothetical protein
MMEPGAVGRLTAALPSEPGGAATPADNEQPFSLAEVDL